MYKFVFVFAVKNLFPSQLNAKFDVVLTHGLRTGKELEKTNMAKWRKKSQLNICTSVAAAAAAEG